MTGILWVLSFAVFLITLSLLSYVIGRWVGWGFDVIIALAFVITILIIGAISAKANDDVMDQQARLSCQLSDNTMTRIQCKRWQQRLDDFEERMRRLEKWEDSRDRR
jgi:flagellar biosynthesis protein FliP